MVAAGIPAGRPLLLRLAQPIHKYLGLFAAVFWLVQAITGVALTFRWELDNAMLAGPSVPLNIAALGARIESIEHAGGEVGSVWSMNVEASRFDLLYADDSGENRVMRVDGAGVTLRDRSDATFASDVFFSSLMSIHTSLLSGEVGSWIIGISGLLLLTHLILGVRLAVPRLKVLRAVLFMKPAGGLRARLYAWHRGVGLWLSVPAIIVVCTGMLLVFHDGVGNVVGGKIPAPAAPASASETVTRLPPAEVMRIALGHLPGSRLSAVAMPTHEEPWYRIRLQEPGAMPRMWGTSTLYLSASDGHILSDHPAGSGGAGRTFVESLYPIHTGQIGGFAGRGALLVLGIWFVLMTVLGVRMWLARR